MFTVILLLLYFGDVTGGGRPDEFNTDFMKWLLTGFAPNQSHLMNQRNRQYEYEGFDGWYNNFGRPDLGAVDTPLLRRVPAAYKDGVYEPSGFNRPHPIELSEKLLDGTVGTRSRTGKNAFLVFFGQQVVEEILDAQRAACPPEYINLKIPEKHRYSTMLNHSEMPVLRTRYDARTGYSPNNPRQQLNEITPFFDGGLIYGTTKAWSDALRTNKDGKIEPYGLLATSQDGWFPARNDIRLPMANPPPPANHSTFIKRHYIESVDRFFRLGNPRGNENPFLFTFGVLWFRWHNQLARNLHILYPNWSSDEVFNEARKWVIATQQHIVTNEWLKAWLGTELPPYTGYDPTIDPQIDQFFQAAAFRFGHTLVPAGVRTRHSATENCRLGPIIRTCQSFWRPEEAILATVKENESLNIGMERLIMGMMGQLCEEEDHKIVEDLRGNVFGPLEFSRRDLMALNIQRARDHGLPDYNTVRELFNLSRITDVSEFVHVSAEIQRKIKELYNSLDDIDLWVGGIMETHNGPGELFQKIIIDQFRRIRDGDRFWYKNTKNGLFTESEINRIEKLSFYDILMNVTNLIEGDIQKNPFQVPLEDDHVVRLCGGIFNTSDCIDSATESKYTCYHATPSPEDLARIPCSPPGTYDYFSNSELSFILTFIGLSAIIIGFVTSLVVILHRKQKQCLKISQKFALELRESLNTEDEMKSHCAKEWIGQNKPERPVLVILDTQKKKIRVLSMLGMPVRALDLKHNLIVKVFISTDKIYVMIRVEHNYDLVMKFESEYLMNKFLEHLETFFEAIGIKAEHEINSKTAWILKQAITRKKRQEILDKFFRAICAQSFKIQDHSNQETVHIDSKLAKEVVYTELTITEFAEVFCMSPDSAFIKKMFRFVDKDKNDFISFREFMDMTVIFYKGTPEQKIKLMFDMYDMNGAGSLSREEFANMLRSLVETVNGDLKEAELNVALETMINAVGLADKQMISFDDFQRLFSEYKEQLSMEFKLPGAQTIFQSQSVAENLYGDSGKSQSRSQSRRDKEAEQIIDKDTTIVIVQKHVETYWYAISKYIADKQLQIFWLFLYTAVLIAIFAERAYHYQVEREHSGLRRIAGAGVTFTRGAASAMMFTYSTLLLTMCQNSITQIRKTFLQIYIPVDSSVEMHKYIACWALFFTVVHVLGHAVNFYHISTQTSDDLTCLFPNFFHATHEIPKFHYWCWQTLTGVTGILLTINVAMIFLFSLPVIRRRLYNWFWFAHSMYPIFYILLILHGTGRLIQDPISYSYLSGPVILFTLDKIITAMRKTAEIQVLKGICLPSGVTYLEFRKPSDFRYKSGQWVRIACPEFNANEYHPFTLSSSPNETNLTVHIRAVGPWTSKIQCRVDPLLTIDRTLPKIRIDGPYGDAAQDWYKYDVGIMVGGGIGVTPFASILKDIVYKSNVHQDLGCKKIYFLWVTRTQRQFEWMIDILRELEAADTNGIVSTHIFITQFYQKYDMRTVLLYICELYFQRVSNKSLFTGLTAITHFGRPNFLQFFKAIKRNHSRTSSVGVFSCGSRSMRQAVDQACRKLNQDINDETLFKHHYKSL